MVRYGKVLMEHFFFIHAQKVRDCADWQINSCQKLNTSAAHQRTIMRDLAGNQEKRTWLTEFHSCQAGPGATVEPQVKSRAIEHYEQGHVLIEGEEKQRLHAP